MKSLIGIILSTILLSFTCCNRKNKNLNTQKTHFEFSTQIENIVNNQNEDTNTIKWLNKHTFINDSSTNFCSKINSTNQYGIGAEINIPKQLWHSNFVLSLKSKLKKAGNTPNFSIIIQIEINDSLIFWERRELNKNIHKKYKWQTILEEIKFPKNFSNKGACITLYFMNQDTVNAYVDDLVINLSKLPLPTFIPKIDKRKLNCSHKLDKTFINKYYRINLCSRGHLQVLDRKGDYIFNGLTHVIETLQPNDSVPLTYSTSSFKIKEFKDKSVVLTTSNSICKIDFEINTESKNGNMKYSTKTTFLDTVQLHREALIFSYIGKLKEVYKKNRKVDLYNFEDEYWLEKQGCKIGSRENTFYIYNQQNISSLQLDNKNNFLIVNLDYSKDHPLLHFPLMDKANNTYQDISCNTYRKNEIRKNNFNFSIGQDNDFFPRIMRNPHGYLATYVFTEHADYTDIKTQRATYFGSSKITHSNQATGGFIKHKVPVTKSVFYSNDDKEMNDDKRNNTSFNSQITSIKHTPYFLDFLLDIKKYNIDLCLHTPEQKTTTKNNLITAAQFVQKYFTSSCWIDHGYDNGISNNRENIVCDGLNKISQFYSLAILKKNNIKYFWNCYYEDVRPFNGFNFYSFISSPYIGFGNPFPTPYYWQHQSKAPGVYFWPTNSVTEPGNNWEYFFNKQRINDFINNYSVEFNHCYPAWINSEKGFWIYTEKNELVINPYFDKTLKMLSDYRNKRLINLTTIKKILDYWTSIENVTIQNIKKNKFNITNNSGKFIHGFSIAVKANRIFINNKIPKHKSYLNDFIYWFDLKPKEKKTITLKKIN